MLSCLSFYLLSTDETIFNNKGQKPLTPVKSMSMLKMYVSFKRTILKYVQYREGQNKPRFLYPFYLLSGLCQYHFAPSCHHFVGIVHSSGCINVISRHADCLLLNSNYYDTNLSVTDYFVLLE